MLDIAGFRKLKEVKCPFDIGVIVSDRVCDGWTNSCTGRDVDDGMYWAWNMVRSMMVPDVFLNPGKLWMVHDFGDVLSFDLRVVEWVEIVKDSDFVTFGQKLFR